MNKTDLLQRAVSNNAHWCEAVVKAHGCHSKVDSAYWYSEGAVPLFYPNAVTLSADGKDKQLEIIRRLTESHPKDYWAVKDSYAALDLTSEGFFKLFNACWYAIVPMGIGLSTNANSQIFRVENEEQLSAWESAWAKCQSPEPANRIFPTALLNSNETFFLARANNGQVTDGMIAYFSDGVIGISNLFNLSIDDGEGIAPYLTFLNEAFGRHPFVGYESEDDLKAVKEQGVDLLGNLNVWMKRND